jgi:hypothetical protein
VLLMAVSGCLLDTHVTIAPLSITAHPLTLLLSSAPAWSASALADSWLGVDPIPTDSKLASDAFLLQVMPSDLVPARYRNMRWAAAT